MGDARLAKIREALGLTADSNIRRILREISRLRFESWQDQNQQMDRHRETREALSDAVKRLQRAENPDNWRAVWTGDTATDDVHSTALTHGNLVELSGVGQVLLHFHPCCQNLDCKCEKRSPEGYCDCHANDE